MNKCSQCNGVDFILDKNGISIKCPACITRKLIETGDADIVRKTIETNIAGLNKEIEKARHVLAKNLERGILGMSKEKHILNACENYLYVEKAKLAAFSDLTQVKKGKSDERKKISK